jgi:hypothetical protein
MASSWVADMFGLMDSDQSGAATVAELVAACSPTEGNVWDCTGAGACVKVTLAESDRRRVGCQGALRYLMQLSAMDATLGTTTLADSQISLAELQQHAATPFYDLCALSGDTAHVLAQFEGYLVHACDLLRNAGFGAEADELQQRMAPQ